MSHRYCTIHHVPDTTFIYALCDPDGSIRYVGKADNPQRRLTSGHLAAGRLAERSPKNSWLKGLLERGERPLLQILEQIPCGGWETAEIRWITTLREQGARLTNGAPGGLGGDVMSPEARERHRKIMTGRTASQETRAKMSAAAKARTTPELRDQCRARAIACGATPPTGRGEANGFSRFTEEQIVEMRLQADAGVAYVQIAKMFGTSTAQVSYVVTGTTWAHAGGPIQPRRIKTRLTDLDVCNIRRLVAAGESQSVVAKQYGLVPSYVSQIVSGRRRARPAKEVIGWQ